MAIKHTTARYVKKRGHRGNNTVETHRVKLVTNFKRARKPDTSRPITTKRATFCTDFSDRRGFNKWLLRKGGSFLKYEWAFNLCRSALAPSRGSRGEITFQRRHQQPTYHLDDAKK